MCTCMFSGLATIATFEPFLFCFFCFFFFSPEEYCSKWSLPFLSPPFSPFLLLSSSLSLSLSFSLSFSRTSSSLFLSLCLQIPEYCQLDEFDVLDNAFELIFAFDEIVALGYRESVNLAQIRTFTEMDSHEERVFEAMRKVLSPPTLVA